MGLKNSNTRVFLMELLEQLMPYDVISFDIFDTAIYRKVDMPNDVFTIMAMEIGHGDFVNVRKTAENVARERKEALKGTREVTLAEIYDVLEEDYGINRSIMEQEIDLELMLSTINPYIFQVYKELLKEGKRILFTSDMYLPQQIIEEILQKNGYTKYERLYLSNSYGLRKGDGTLQKIILRDYAEKKIVHIGDSQIGDVAQSIHVGMDAIFHKDAREIKSEKYTDNLSGSIYRAVVNNNMYNGIWNENIYYSHGFKVGGILAVGYCEYINQVARLKNIDKILFCSRDCEVIWKIYNQYFEEYENEYIEISRYAVMGITSERYLYDWAERFIFRYVGKDCSDRTIEQLLQEAGFSYLVEHLKEMDIDKELTIREIKRGRLKRFIFAHAELISEYNRENIAAAKQYFERVLGTSKNILIVDIGWSGTCVTTLKYFLETHFSDIVHNVSGTLMCTTGNKTLTAYMEAGVISSYIYSPFHNMDLFETMISDVWSSEELDYRHLALEYLFTSAKGTLIKYRDIGNGNVEFEHSEIFPPNIMEILNMQEGMIQFAKKYQEYRNSCGGKYLISPYVAFKPLLAAIHDKKYMYNIYCNFLHDSSWMPYTKDINKKTFRD